MAPIKVWELCGADKERVFSPFCWASRKFTEKEKLQAASGQGKVPIIEDSGKVVNDSFDIALYLERTYPDKPSLFGGPGGEAAARFVNNWAMLAAVRPFLWPLMICEVYKVLDGKDQAYFREEREKQFGKKLEEVCPESEHAGLLAGFREALEPLRATLGGQLFLGGERPLYTDIIVFSFFMWARCVSPKQLLDADDPVHAWRERMLDAFGGAGRRAVGFAV